MGEVLSSLDELENELRELKPRELLELATERGLLLTPGKIMLNLSTFVGNTFSSFMLTSTFTLQSKY